MSLPDRLIDRLMLRAADETHVQRGVLLIEDALRTASLPESFGGKLVIIRTLNLGKIAAASSPTSVSLQLEWRLREVWATAVHATDPSASSAPAVYFHDVLEPYILLAIRLLRHQPVNEWFWVNAVPTWQPDHSPHEMLREIIFDVMETQAGVVGIGALVTTLAEMGLMDGLLECLYPADGPTLLQRMGWSNNQNAAPPIFLRAHARPVPYHRRDAALWRRWLNRWGAQDDRLLWLIGTTLIAQHPAYAQAAAFDWQIAATLHHLVQHQTAASDDSYPVSPDLPPDFYILPSASKVDFDEQPAFNPPSLSLLWGEVQPSYFAGLFLLLPLLNRLNIAGWLDVYPLAFDLDFPTRLLHFCASRLGADPDDPVCLALPPLNPVPPEMTDFDFVLPSHWEGLAQPGRILSTTESRTVMWDGSGRLPLALWHDHPSPAAEGWLSDEPSIREPIETVLSDLDLLLGAWLIGLRRWLRRYAGIGLRDLIQRPGQIAYTRTHIDVFWDGYRVEMRIRRSGLDLDPGWVAWLGRVVQFHYLFDDE